MALIQHGRPNVLQRPNRPGPNQPAWKRAGSAYDCYCGWGPDCPLFRVMTTAQRVECTRDKRAYAQLLWRNGTV